MAAGPNENDWAADRKVGFAMGILLIGIVAALFFRNQPLSVEQVPLVEREKLLDSRLRDRDITVYADERHIPGSDTDLGWTLPEVLKRFKRDLPGVALPIGQMSPAIERATPEVKHAHDSTKLRRRLPAKRPSAASKRTDYAAGPTSAAVALNVSDDDVSMDQGQTQPLQTDYVEYTVRYGDTLSRIADKLLGSASRYQEIYDANRDRITNPDQLQVGAAIRIPRL